MTEYMRNENYGSIEHPSICFGFNIEMEAENNIELELIFNDM